MMHKRDAGCGFSPKMCGEVVIGILKVFWILVNLYVFSILYLPLIAGGSERFVVKIPTKSETLPRACNVFLPWPHCSLHA